MKWIVLVLLCSCEPLPFVLDRSGNLAHLDVTPTTWSFDCGFPEANKWPVRSGFSYWNVLAGKEIFREEPDCSKTNETTSYFEFVVMASYANYETDTPMMQGTVFEVPPTEYATTTRRMIESQQIIGAVILFYKPWFEQQNLYEQTSVARHVIGHALGFKHNGAETCIMYPSINTEHHKYYDETKAACREEKEILLSLYGSR